MRDTRKSLRTTVGAPAMVALVATVAGCSFGQPQQGPEPSPTPSTVQVRYDPVRYGFCDDSAIREVPVSLGLTNQVSDSDRFRHGYQDGHLYPEGATWDWWAAICRYAAYAEKDGYRRWFDPRGTIVVRVFSDPEPAYDYYRSEHERGLYFEDPETSLTREAVVGWWDEATRFEQIDTRTMIDKFVAEYHIYDDNLYMFVPLVTEIYREEEAEAVIERSHELLDALIAELIAHVPLAAGE